MAADRDECVRLYDTKGTSRMGQVSTGFENRSYRCIERVSTTNDTSRMEKKKINV